MTDLDSTNRLYIPPENRPLKRIRYSENVKQWEKSTSVQDVYKYEISRNRPAFFLTLVFKTGTKDCATEKLQNEFYDRLNFLLMKNAYKRKTKWIHGLCCRERQSAAMEYTQHFHWVVFDNGNYLKTFEAKQRFIRKAHKARRFVCREKILIDSLEIEEAYRTDPDIDDGKHTIYTYPLKNFNKMWLSEAQAADSIAYLHPDGILFGDEELFKPKGYDVVTFGYKQFYTPERLNDI